MSTDFSIRERAFVSQLETETGRDLDGWMAAIGEAGLSHRNEIIDWLRTKGFTFARASWMERIHHNGGRLIYADAAQRTPAEPAKRKPKVAAAPRVTANQEAAIKAAVKADGEIDNLLAAAKAYRPLAQVLLRDILAAAPGADARAAGQVIVLSHVKPFAAVMPGPKDVRLMLAAAGRPLTVGWQKSKWQAGVDSLSSLTHMLVLTDVRQLTPELRTFIALCAREAG